ncbi:MAG: PTS glucose transporter subunit IIA [Eubacteriales bacterium]|nr:PTS glucose transporter subunit IIA [Eubacteriales bacterium]
MGIFGGLFGKKEEKKVITAASPVKGKCISITKVNDPTFSAEVLGKGIAVIPSEGVFYAPADGKVTMAFAAGHAVSMETLEGAELLLHVGIDTVELQGKYFHMEVSDGQNVKRGDVLLRADLEGIRGEGYDTAAMLVVCNTGDFAEINCTLDKEVQPGDEVMRLYR